MTENAEKIQELVEEINKRQAIIDKEEKALLKTLDRNYLGELKADINFDKREAHRILFEDPEAALEYFENSDFYKNNYNLLNEAQAVIFPDSAGDSELSGTAERALAVYVILAMQYLKEAQNGICFINDGNEEKTLLINPEKLFLKFDEVSKENILPDVAKIVDRKDFKRALLTGLQNEWDSPQYNDFGKVKELISIDSLPLFYDVSSGRIRDLSILGKKFSHSMLENTKGLDSVEKIWDINADVASSLDEETRDKVAGIIGMENLIYQVGNGGLDQYFFNGYNKTRGFSKRGPMSYGVDDLSFFIQEELAPRMADLGLLNCDEKLNDFGKRIDGLVYVDDPKDFADDVKQNLVESYIDGMETEDLYSWYSDYIGRDISIYNELSSLADENPEFEELSDFDDIVCKYTQWNDLPEELQELLYDEIDSTMRNYGERIVGKMMDDPDILTDAYNTVGQDICCVCEEIDSEYWPLDNVEALEKELYDLEEAIAPVINQMSDEIVNSEQYKNAVSKVNQRGIYTQVMSADDYKKEARAVAKGVSGKTHDTDDAVR